MANPPLFPILQKPPAPSATAIDPVCGMNVDPQRAAATTTYQGLPYYFCCKGCQTKFEADPQRYLHPQAKPEPMTPPQGAANIEYTCPMHPEVRQIGPGACPKCGMALEPATF